MPERVTRYAVRLHATVTGPRAAARAEIGRFLRGMKQAAAHPGETAVWHRDQEEPNAWPVTFHLLHDSGSAADAAAAVRELYGRGAASVPDPDVVWALDGVETRTAHARDAAPGRGRQTGNGATGDPAAGCRR